jgi:hypothetical protein
LVLKRLRLKPFSPSNKNLKTKTTQSKQGAAPYVR